MNKRRDAPKHKPGDQPCERGSRNITSQRHGAGIPAQNILYSSHLRRYAIVYSGKVGGIDLQGVDAKSAKIKQKFRREAQTSRHKHQNLRNCNTCQTEIVDPLLLHGIPGILIRAESFRIGRTCRHNHHRPDPKPCTRMGAGCGGEASRLSKHILAIDKTTSARSTTLGEYA
jgi:hypothetical protein